MGYYEIPTKGYLSLPDSFGHERRAPDAETQYPQVNLARSASGSLIPFLAALPLYGDAGRIADLEARDGPDRYARNGSFPRAWPGISNTAELDRAEAWRGRIGPERPRRYSTSPIPPADRSLR